MTTSRVRFEARGERGWIEYDPETKAVEIDHPAPDISRRLRRFYEERRPVRTPVGPGIDEDREDLLDGLGNADLFARRTMTLEAEFLLGRHPLHVHQSESDY